MREVVGDDFELDERYESPAARDCRDSQKKRVF
jgi:hypothetical protein